MKYQSSKPFLFPASYAVLAGLAAFMSFVGWRPLLPSNIAWLEHGDPATFYLGWQFFRNAEWAFPIGLNPDYGLELSSSILFSDSIPLFAFIFKIFSHSLPEVFQYFGIWLLLCLVLQGWFAYKLMGLLSTNKMVCVLGASLFMCAPPMVWRVQGHFALVAHFLILAALYLALSDRSKTKSLSWVFLLALAALIHPYLLALTGLIWVADGVNRYVNTQLTFQKALVEFTIVLAMSGLACWQAGYFVIGDGAAAEGFGYYRMNVLSILSANGFSYVLQNIPTASGDYEGFNFLGLGVILLAIFVLAHVVTMRFSDLKINTIHFLKKWRFMIWLMIALTLFALSNRIGIANYSINFNLPDPLLSAANIFRASGRMFWPVYYLILFATIYLCLRFFSTKLSIFLLGFALCVQYIDTSNAWMGFRAAYKMPPSATWVNNMHDPFWSEAAKKYTKVQVLMPGNSVENWKSIAYFASVHALSTDAIYLGRVGTKALKIARQRAGDMMLSGRFSGESLYFVDESAILFDERDPYKLPINVDSKTDLLARVDGYIVLAPGWKQCTQCTVIPTEISGQELLPPVIELNKRYIFGGEFNTRRYLYGGWSKPEGDGVWSNGKTASLILPIKNLDANKIVFDAKPLISKKYPTQQIEITVNGIVAPLIKMTEGSEARFEITLTDKMKAQLDAKRNYLHLEFNFLDAVSPKDLGINNDERKLAIRLQAVSLMKN